MTYTVVFPPILYPSSKFIFIPESNLGSDISWMIVLVGVLIPVILGAVIGWLMTK